MLKTGKFIIISTGTSNGRMLGFNKRKAEQANIVNGMWWVRWGSLKKKKKVKLHTICNTPGISFFWFLFNWKPSYDIAYWPIF